MWGIFNLEITKNLSNLNYEKLLNKNFFGDHLGGLYRFIAILFQMFENVIKSTYFIYKHLKESKMGK